MDALRKAYTPSPHVELMEVMYDIREWLQPAAIKLHNITTPHCFVIQKNVSGNVVLRYKNWSQDREWLPSKNPQEGINILKVCISNKGLTTCIPRADLRVSGTEGEGERDRV